MGGMKQLSSSPPGTWEKCYTSCMRGGIQYKALCQALTPQGSRSSSGTLPHPQKPRFPPPTSGQLFSLQKCLPVRQIDRCLGWTTRITVLGMQCLHFRHGTIQPGCLKAMF